MDNSERVPQIGKGGWRGWVATSPVQQAGAAYAVVHLGNSGPVFVPVEMLQQNPDGSYSLPLTQEELLRDSRPADPDPVPSPGAKDNSAANAEVVVPVVQEQLEVRKRQWETGGVRVNIAVREREETVDQPLVREEVQVERVPINRVVDTVPTPRQEGETLVIPVVEEVLVVEKRLMLKEEVRVSKRRFEAHEPQKVVLRSEEPQIEQLEPRPAAGDRRAA